jgi:hypothetical protein
MEGDFTRNSDDPRASYSGVLMQQGRVQLDADWNEQWLIQTRALRSMMRDLIGRHGGPSDDLGFGISAEPGKPHLGVGTGTYYVDGIRCEHRGALVLSMDQRRADNYLIFLEVWERHVNAIEDPRIREVALLGPDTATRAEVRWRVRMLSFFNQEPTAETAAEIAEKLVDGELRRRPKRRLAARAQTPNANTDPCELSPRAGYRGRENQLYRVQIHDASPDDKDGVLFTFKWSRDNGSVVFPILPVTIPKGPASAGDNEIVITVKVGHLGRDERFGLAANDIVELVHDPITRETQDVAALHQGGTDPGRSGPLGRVLAPIDPDDLTVSIAVYAPDETTVAEISQHPYLRRWDQRRSPERELRDGAVPVTRDDLNKWLPLEDGVQIMFEGDPKEDASDARPPEVRAGDYWMIPARTATGDVLWPTVEAGLPPGRTPQPAEPAARRIERLETGAAPPSVPKLVPPHGPQRHYAPLAILAWNGNAVTLRVGVRKQFGPLAYHEYNWAP